MPASQPALLSGSLDSNADSAFDTDDSVSLAKKPRVHDQAAQDQATHDHTLHTLRTRSSTIVSEHADAPEPELDAEPAAEPDRLNHRDQPSRDSATTRLSAEPIPSHSARTSVSRPASRPATLLPLDSPASRAAAQTSSFSSHPSYAGHNSRSRPAAPADAALPALSGTSGPSSLGTASRESASASAPAPAQQPLHSYGSDDANDANDTTAFSLTSDDDTASNGNCGNDSDGNDQDTHSSDGLLEAATYTHSSFKAGKPSKPATSSSKRADTAMTAFDMPLEPSSPASVAASVADSVVVSVVSTDTLDMPTSKTARPSASGANHASEHHGVVYAAPSHCDPDHHDRDHEGHGDDSHVDDTVVDSQDTPVGSPAYSYTHAGSASRPRTVASSSSSSSVSFTSPDFGLKSASASSSASASASASWLAATPTPAARRAKTLSSSSPLPAASHAASVPVHSRRAAMPHTPATASAGMPANPHKTPHKTPNKRVSAIHMIGSVLDDIPAGGFSPERHDTVPGSLSSLSKIPPKYDGSGMGGFMSPSGLSMGRKRTRSAPYPPILINGAAYSGSAAGGTRAVGHAKRRRYKSFTSPTAHLTRSSSLQADNGKQAYMCMSKLDILSELCISVLDDTKPSADADAACTAAASHGSTLSLGQPRGAEAVDMQPAKMQRGRDRQAEMVTVKAAQAHQTMVAQMAGFANFYCSGSAGPVPDSDAAAHSSQASPPSSSLSSSSSSIGSSSLAESIPPQLARSCSMSHIASSASEPPAVVVMVNGTLDEEAAAEAARATAAALSAAAVRAQALLQRTLSMSRVPSAAPMPRPLLHVRLQRSVSSGQ
ncbi:hypothetical protein BC831DRAFT_466548 [Entophlyctis helioformis]|nr:hypothetical protein BC831DRAFT_466548 [Entophlyctis helioformis]